ncbi:hypothetical protein XELAEV_18035065mg [Xenopus laevis]|uniref:Uncharacterized protein n=1 Tax=Xenopus laevis TaxID=8355 RepID=A0A974HC51_XENLA|nr:hypothetical protein XELAEV_18035065mg [Xenopus laevis]
MRTAYSNDGQMVMCQSVRIINFNNKCPYHSDSAKSPADQGKKGEGWSDVPHLLFLLFMTPCDESTL